jgi:hypothetical protein
MTKAGLFFRTALYHTFTTIDSKWVKLLVHVRQHKEITRIPENDVRSSYSLVEIINTVPRVQSVHTKQLSHETISLLSLLLSELGWDGEGPTQGATLPASRPVTCRTAFSSITE